MFCINEYRNLVGLIRPREILSIQTRNLVMADTQKPVETAIRNKIISNLNPVHLDVINESYMHNVPKGSETHFKVIVVSDKFENVSLVQRHRTIQQLLGYELENGVHALSIVAKTPTQWSEDSEVKPSPKCLGGNK
ncbi:UNVERIFIED_CONTAM: hypothetical protein PYX00_007577 [Menopon gallinae]|uniref:BolA-like protein DDB_G0274169 n=1 Tax=Menopon gallinae TaxID=328185 RepID=A0AAW2HKI9_9NEOP